MIIIKSDEYAKSSYNKKSKTMVNGHLFMVENNPGNFPKSKAKFPQLTPYYCA